MGPGIVKWLYITLHATGDLLPPAPGEFVVGDAEEAERANRGDEERDDSQRIGRRN